MTQDIPLDSAATTADEGRGGPDIGSGVKKVKSFVLQNIRKAGIALHWMSWAALSSSQLNLLALKAGSPFASKAAFPSNSQTP